VLAGIKDAQRIPLELLAVLEPLHQTVAVVRVHSQPLSFRGIGRRESGGKIRIAIVAGKGEKAIQLRAQAVGRGQVESVVAFEHVECAAVGGYAAERSGDVDIRVGVSIAVRVGREIIRDEVAAHGDVLGNGFAVIAGHAGNKILRCLDAPEAVSMGNPGMEMGAPGRPGLASSSSSRTITFSEGSGEASVTSLR